jgi:hypothetical protein
MVEENFETCVSNIWPRINYFGLILIKSFTMVEENFEIWGLWPRIKGFRLLFGKNASPSLNT